MPPQRLLSAGAQTQSHQGARVGRLIFDDAYEVHATRGKALSLDVEASLVGDHEDNGVRRVGQGPDDGLARSMNNHGRHESER